MTANQYRASLKRLGLSQVGAAPYLGIGRRTSQGYALAESEVHGAVAILLRLLIAGKITTKDIEIARD